MPQQAPREQPRAGRTPPESATPAAVTAQLVAFLSPRMTQVRAAARTGMPPPSGELPSRLYVYWAQGFASAPDVVQACYRRLLRVHGEARVVALDDENVRGLVDLPDYVWRKLASNRPALSDVIRLDLLGRHGGVWVDATCWAESDVSAAVRPVCTSGFFAFRRGDRPLASWLLASEAGNYTVLLWRQALLTYWQHFDRRSNYFLMHYLFAALCELDDEFRARWHATPPVSARAPHRFQHAMREPFDDARYQRLLEEFFVHKLTYKVEPAAVGSGTMLGHLIEEDADTVRTQRRPLQATVGSRAGQLRSPRQLVRALVRRTRRVVAGGSEPSAGTAGARPD